MDVQPLRNFLRADEAWENASNLTARVMAWQFNLQGREPKPKGAFVANHSFLVEMIGYPENYMNLSENESGR